MYKSRQEGFLKSNSTDEYPNCHLSTWYPRQVGITLNWVVLPHIFILITVDSCHECTPGDRPLCDLMLCTCPKIILGGTLRSAPAYRCSFIRCALISRCTYNRSQLYITGNGWSSISGYSNSLCANNVVFEANYPSYPWTNTACRQ